MKKRDKNKKQEKEILPPGAEAARREMLHHLKGREYRIPHKLLNRWIAANDSGKHIWRAIVKQDRMPKKLLYLPGAR